MIAAPSVYIPRRSLIDLEIVESRYSVRLAQTQREVESALRLRFDVFKRELSAVDIGPATSGLEFDAYDFKCDHLIVVETDTGRTIGTYRLNSIETAVSARGFYSYGEFSIEDLPFEILESGIELGRACVAREHRNSKVLFLLWKGLAAYLRAAGKRYFFGCCSIFSRDASVGAQAYRQLYNGGHVHDSMFIAPKVHAISCPNDVECAADVELPNLFQMYLRMGAKVCGPPMLDREFGTIDFFVVFDVENLNDKYRAMFFG
jgi:putative hemolysin